MTHREAYSWLLAELGFEASVLTLIILPYHVKFLMFVYEIVSLCLSPLFLFSLPSPSSLLPLFSAIFQVIFKGHTQYLDFFRGKVLLKN